MEYSDSMKYQHINWSAELDEYFSLPKSVSIRRFTADKPYSYYAFRDRLRKDERYEMKHHESTEDGGGLQFLPVTVVKSSCPAEITINGFRICVDSGTSDIALRKVLNAVRDL